MGREENDFVEPNWLPEPGDDDFPLNEKVPNDQVKKSRHVSPFIDENLPTGDISDKKTTPLSTEKKTKKEFLRIYHGINPVFCFDPSTKKHDFAYLADDPDR